MDVKKIETPWKHLVIDNFLEPDVFSYVQSYVSDNYNLKTQSKPVAEIHTESSNSKLFELLSPYILMMRDKFYDEMNYSNKVLPNTMYSFVELAICHPGFAYRYIHSDNRDDFKLMTTVLYVSPEEGNGTELYSSKLKSSFVEEIEWKPNRALSFVGTENPKYQGTWHNYKNTKPHARASINLILSSKPNGIY